jgi:hypothetical protein
MGKNLLPKQILTNYEVYEYRHACSIIKYDFPNEWDEIIAILSNFKLNKSDILQAGGRKSPIAEKLDAQFYNLGWVEKQFKTQVLIDDVPHDSPTHKIDCFKNRIALEVEWNNKDPFYDRDLNNFRLLFDLDAISVGVIITRCSELQAIFKELGKGESYGTSTTHLGKLLPKIEGKSGGGCPILVFGIKPVLFDSTN